MLRPFSFAAILEAMTAIRATQMSYAEYLKFEEASETKHEYVNGEVYAMAGGSLEHARLASELIFLLREKFGPDGCRVFGSDLRLRVEATKRSAYPDVTIVCDDPETSALDRAAVTNPTVLIEVLSPSTESTDRIEKWAHYRRIPSLQAYVLVSQTEQRIEAYRRDGTRWIYEEAGPSETLRIGGLEVDVAVDSLYANALATVQAG